MRIMFDYRNSTALKHQRACKYLDRRSIECMNLFYESIQLPHCKFGKNNVWRPLRDHKWRPFVLGYSGVIVTICPWIICMLQQ